VPLIIAHRGDSGARPENTLSAFRSASELEVDMIEFDVQPSSDMKLVVIHDEDVTRTTNGSGNVGDLTLDKLKALDAGSWFDPRFENERIPTLEEVLDVIPDTVDLNIELKGFPGTVSYEDEFLRIFRRYRLHGRAFVASGDDRRLRHIKELEPTVRCILLQWDRDEEASISKAVEIDADVIQIRRDYLRRRFIEHIHDAGLLVFLFFADTPAEFLRASRLGVDGILTNWPGRMKNLIEE